MNNNDWCDIDNLPEPPLSFSETDPEKSVIYLVDQ
jgi:hypothetical protein